MVQGKARAKINLDLRVLDRRPDGYHNLETLFARIALHDTVAVWRIEDGVELVVHGDAGGANAQTNLAHRAATALRAACGRRDGVRIELTKRIPTGAGLGGGSADAGATLRLVNTLWDSPLTEGQLMDIGATLGADVAFLTSELSAAWGRGRGDELTPANLPRGGALVLAMPPLQIDTAEAYRSLGEPRTRAAKGVTPRLEESDLGSWDTLSSRCSNDFEPSVHARYPQLADLRRSMEGAGALLARMSGSGAAHFALFDQEKTAEAASADLRVEYPDVQFLATAFE